MTLFEATLAFGLLLAWVDILEKKGNTFRLIEVKAKSFDSTEQRLSHFCGKRGAIETKWLPYLEDVAFQTHILQSLFPSGRAVPRLKCLAKAYKPRATWPDECPAAIFYGNNVFNNPQKSGLLKTLFPFLFAVKSSMHES